MPASVAAAHLNEVLKSSVTPLSLQAYGYYQLVLRKKNPNKRFSLNELYEVQTVNFSSKSYSLYTD